MSKGFQAKHLSEEAVLAAIRQTRDQARPPGWRTATVWDVQRALPHVPEKVVVSKLRGMVRRGVVEGCCCGCRGDFLIPGDE